MKALFHVWNIKRSWCQFIRGVDIMVPWIFPLRTGFILDFRETIVFENLLNKHTETEWCGANSLPSTQKFVGFDNDEFP